MNDNTKRLSTTGSSNINQKTYQRISQLIRSPHKQFELFLQGLTSSISDSRCLPMVPGDNKVRVGNTL